MNDCCVWISSRSACLCVTPSDRIQSRIFFPLSNQRITMIYSILDTNLQLRTLSTFFCYATHLRMCVRWNELEHWISHWNVNDLMRKKCLNPRVFFNFRFRNCVVDKPISFERFDSVDEQHTQRCAKKNIFSYRQLLERKERVSALIDKNNNNDDVCISFYFLMPGTQCGAVKIAQIKQNYRQSKWCYLHEHCGRRKGTKTHNMLPRRLFNRRNMFTGNRGHRIANATHGKFSNDYRFQCLTLFYICQSVSPRAQHIFWKWPHASSLSSRIRIKRAAK